VLCGKWQIGRLLGVGGMSTVYEAVHRNGRRVAIKILHPELSSNTRSRQRFLREGYIANRVGHPGAVTILDDGVADDGTVFLVLELLRGQTLGDRLRRSGALPASEVLACTDRVLDILASAHEHGIIHRDVKPDNLFLTHDRTLKLLDFGIASVRELSIAGIEPTGAGAALGTPAFMAPEQAMGCRDPIDHRADLWALGATMLTLLTGRHIDATGERPLGAPSDVELPGAVSPHLDVALAKIIDVALQFDRSRRWADARCMQRALRRCGLPELELPSPSLPTDSGVPDVTGGQTLTPPTESLVQGAEGAVSSGKVSSRSHRTLSAGIAIGVLVGVIVLPVTRSRQSVPAVALPEVSRLLDVSPPSLAQPVASPVIVPLPAWNQSTETVGAIAREARRRRDAGRGKGPASVKRAHPVSLTSDEILDRRE